MVGGGRYRKVFVPRNPTGSCRGSSQEDLLQGLIQLKQTHPDLSFPHDLQSSPLVSELLPLLPFAPFLIPEFLWFSGGNFPLLPLRVCLGSPCHIFLPDPGFTKTQPIGISQLRRPNSGRYDCLHYRLIFTHSSFCKCASLFFPHLSFKMKDLEHFSY